MSKQTQNIKIRTANLLPWPLEVIKAIVFWTTLLTTSPRTTTNLSCRWHRKILREAVKSLTELVVVAHWILWLDLQALSQSSRFKTSMNCQISCSPQNWIRLLLKINTKTKLNPIGYLDESVNQPFSIANFEGTWTKSSSITVLSQFIIQYLVQLKTSTSLCFNQANESSRKT